MKASFLTIRLISSVAARRIYVPVLIVFSCISVLVIGLLVWAVTVDAWWWLLLAPCIILTVIGIVALIITRLIIALVTPTHSTTQKDMTSQLVDTLLRLSEITGTPKVFLLFSIVRDVINPRKDGFIGSLTNDTASLKRDFTALQSSFTQK